jgi:hypothetical protein
MLTQGKDTLRFPMTPEEASRILASYLWECEKKEIHQQDVIYFFPVAERKKEVERDRRSRETGPKAYGVINEETNDGFDND